MPVKSQSSSLLFWKLSAFYSAYFLAFGIYMPYWPLWLDSIGLNPIEIGWILAGTFWIKVIVQPAATQFVDKKGQTRLLTTLLMFLSSMALGYSISGDSFKANLEIDTINFGKEYALISASGRAGEYGAVYADYKLMPSNDERNSGTISGLARAINDDGVLTGANLTGVYKRNGGIISIYMLDELTNGVIHYVEGTINVVSKKIDIEVYPK